MKHKPGIGATPDLSLRVSVATLVPVVFKHPLTDELMLALERKATLHNAGNEKTIGVKSQPFGGAIRILDMEAIQELIGDFQFDSERSHAEQDFRIFIRPSNWPVLREFCIQHLSSIDDPILETDPSRELIEEFFDALKFNLHPTQYTSKSVATVVQDEATPTENIRAKGILTVRVYQVFETVITDSALANTLLTNSEVNTDEKLHKLAWDDFQNGGQGRANAVLALPLKQIGEFYSASTLQERNAPISFENNRLDETVPAVFENLNVPKYQRR